jgi:PAS domain S-box-containing protein
MADLVRAYDWSATPLGPIATWSKELLTIVTLTLCSPSPARTMWGPDFILIYNDAYRPIPGPRHPAALGKSAREVYAESWHVVGPLLEKAFATGETFFYEKLLVPLPTDHGVQDFYLNYSFNPIFEDGKIAGLFGPLQDVTGEVTAIRKLRESEARATRILQSIGDAVIVTDADAHITHINPIAEALTGWPLAEAEGRPLTEIFRIVNEDTREVVESPAAKVKRLGTIVGLANHTILTSKDGTETHIDDSGAPIRNDAGDLAGIVLVFRDINERRAAERERDAATAQLNQVLETTTDAIISVDRNWRISFLNEHARTIVAPIELYVGRPFFEAFPNAVYEGSPYVENYTRAMNHGLAGEFVAHYTDPLNIWVQVIVRPSPDGIVIFFRDVTSVRRAEAALLQSEKLAAVGRLASSIAHEINNPLESVMNLIYLARQRAVNEETKEFLDIADQELRRVSIIANQTLRFHKQLSNPQAISSVDLFSTVLSIHEGRLKNSNIQVQKSFLSQQPVVCFEGDIRQVLNNLVGNAIDAMPTGGRLQIRSRNGTHWPTGRKGLVLSVADTGCGMSPEILSNIFEAFFTTKGMGGTGLGLWVSQEIVTRHNGALKVRSTQRDAGSGTVFNLFLPFEAECS